MTWDSHFGPTSNHLLILPFNRHNISNIYPFLTSSTTKLLMHSLDISCLDYCKDLLLIGQLLHRLFPLQTAMNAVARLIHLVNHSVVSSYIKTPTNHSLCSSEGLCLCSVTSPSPLFMLASRTSPKSLPYSGIPYPNQPGYRLLCLPLGEP